MNLLLGQWISDVNSWLVGMSVVDHQTLVHNGSLLLLNVDHLCPAQEVHNWSAGAYALCNQ